MGPCSGYNKILKKLTKHVVGLPGAEKILPASAEVVPLVQEEQIVGPGTGCDKIL